MSDFCDVSVLSVDGAVARLRVDVVHEDVRHVPSSKTFVFLVMLDLFNVMRRRFLHGAQPCSDHEAYELTETHPRRERMAAAFGFWLDSELARLVVVAHDAVAEVRLEDQEHRPHAGGSRELPSGALLVTMNDPAWLWHLRPGLVWSTDARDVEANLYDVCREANVTPEQVKEPVEQAVGARVKHAAGGFVIDAIADPEDSSLALLQGFVVVSNVDDPRREVARDELLRLGTEADVGDEVLLHLLTLDRRLNPHDPPVAMPRGVEPLRGVARDLVASAAADAAREAIVGVLRASLSSN